jgi:hypothetical protein
MNLTPSVLEMILPRPKKESAAGQEYSKTPRKGIVLGYPGN